MDQSTSIQYKRSYTCEAYKTPRSLHCRGAWWPPLQAPPPLHPNPNLQALEDFLMHDDNDPLPNSSQQNDFSPLLHDEPPVETFIEESVRDKTNIRSSDFGNPIRLSVWPCSCQILREITHTNGVEITKLEIHGRVGVICHAVLEKYSLDLTTNRNHEYTMLDVRRVKQFLVEYCMERKLNAYIMLHDPLSSFYEAVCVGLDWEDSPVVTDDLVPQDSGDLHMNQILPYVENSRSVNKTTLFIQRERTRKLTIRDLVGYFHLPIEVAAKKIQIRSIEKKISRRARSLTSMEAEERDRAQAEIDTLQQEISDIYSKINV
ncbi:hypothetical protein L1987_01820 [Smallanthus sonchifolius]|uniref:Uncharacterized protein n=1 Tax=Smallanthus sonchifolius TaxID=185202 RepID=A0ACB9K645_9ASTR|nr:hypothetical protein L1987_01820 [Smallanthus sonchifolius]